MSIHSVQPAGLVFVVAMTLIPAGRVYPQGSVTRGPVESIRNRELEKTAGHNLEVARFYFKKRNWVAARSRLQDIIKDYPEFSQIAEVYFLLGEVYRVTSDRELAIELYSRLVEEFPDSEFAGRARERLRELNAQVKKE